MKIRKKGKLYSFPHSFILVIGYMRSYLHLPYRQTEGIIKATVGKSLPFHPSYGHICKRINRLSVDIKKEDDGTDSDDDCIIIAANDIAGIKVTKEVNGCLTNWVQ